MISKAFQNVINQMDHMLTFPVGVMDADGYVLATNSREPSAGLIEGFLSTCEYPNELYTYSGYTLYGIGGANKCDYLVFVKGEGQEANKICTILAVSFANIRLYYDEKYDKTTFIKNIITDNALPLDMRQKAKELHITFDKMRAVFVIKVIRPGDIEAFEVFAGLFADKEHDFVLSMDENTIVFVKELAEKLSPKQLEEIGKNIGDNLCAEALMNVVVGIGTISENIKELAASYKEAQVALEIGRVFEADKYVISYENLGVGRLIYHLPIRLCEMFLQEVLKKKGIDSLNEETINTIYKFFENDLNVSETARQLYIHRNTLVYRLDKILKTIGLDLRKFDHAVIFKVAMMVDQYLKANPIKM